ncbi:MAG: NADH-quinone oxidoreductase subunit H [Verrucomicrobiales bacterium]|jgi:NADH-quinone oxidoreductase subunit H
MDWFLILSSIVKCSGLIGVILTMVAYSVYAERRGSALIQDRVGPNRVGIPFTNIRLFGLGQPIADGLKFILKEDFTPGHVRKFYYWLAPALVMIPALVSMSVLPFSSEFHVPFTEYTTSWTIADLNAGPLFIFAVTSLSVYGIVLAGWASNSKYPFLGGVRSSCQMISYEISLGLSIIPLLMIYGNTNFGAIVDLQAENGWALAPFWGGYGFGSDWRQYLLLIPVGVSFIIFMTSIFAETNRLPFDLPECETELVAGYHTEYSSMKFALFFLGEYAAMIIGSGFAVALFFGGWHMPFIAPATTEVVPFWMGLVQIGVFLGKVVALILFFIWIRWTIPRFRYDQLMKLGWVWFFEIAIINVILTAGIIIWIQN